MEDQLKPGEKVPEKALCAAFGVSRTPLREALKVLASEGFVSLQANRGARVTEVTRAELAQAFAVIAALEQLAAEEACRRMGPDTRAEIEAQSRRHVRGLCPAGPAGLFSGQSGGSQPADRSGGE